MAARPRTALVIEDNDAGSKILVRTLAKHGLDSVATTNGAEGLFHYFKNPEPFDVVLLDLMMAEVSGEAFLSVLNSLHDRKICPIPANIIIGTAVDNDAYLRRLSEFDIVHAVLQKPLNLDELSSHIEDLLHDHPQPRAVADAASALIIEDHPNSCSLLAKFLKRRGLASVTAINAAEGLYRYLTNPKQFDVVFLDLLMPEVAGESFLDVLESLRRHGVCNIPQNVIIETVVKNDEYLRRLSEHGCVHAVIQKPLRPSKLSEHVSELLSLPTPQPA